MVVGGGRPCHFSGQIAQLGRLQVTSLFRSVPFSSCDVDTAEQHDSMSVFSCITRANPKLSGVF